MKELQMPDRHHAGAALGWLELGCREDGLKELRKISAVNQRHPDVLEVRWVFLARDEDWEGALKVAAELVSCAPDRASGWLHRAYALRRVSHGGLAQAWEVLSPAAEKFSDEPVIAFNLACYACQMEKLEEARRWFKRAMKIGGKERIRAMALADEDLKAMWEEIRKM